MKIKFSTYFRITVTIVCLAVSTYAMADYPNGYYDSLEGKCGVKLMQAIKNCVRNHTVIPYGNDTWDAFRTTDVKIVDGKSYWWDMYSNELVAVGSSKPEATVMNIEHSVANSWWGGSKNDAYKDIVHLNPSNSNANSRKSNYPLCELSSVTWNNGVTFVGKPKTGQGGGSANGYEPADEYKGDFARVFMYMFTVYDDISWESGKDWMFDTSSDLMFRSWASELLLRWNEKDVVSDKERSRNDGIWEEQHNRNPFIDLPDLADHIWGTKANIPYSLDGNYGGEDPGTDPGIDPSEKETTTSFSWLSKNDTNMGDWTVEDVNLPSTTDKVWDWREYNGTHYLWGSAYISNTPYASKSYAWSPTVSLEDATSASLKFEHAAKYQTTLRTLCKVAVKIDDSKIETVEIPQWPSAGNWNFKSSGGIDLSDYKGHKINVGLLYESTPEGADTWEINNMTLTVNRQQSILESVETDNSVLVEIWGNNILVPNGAKIFDMNGREVSGLNLQRGIYIVNGPNFKTTIKAAVK